MKKKWISILLAAVLCLGQTVPAFAAADEAVKAADRLYGLGLFSGVGTNADGTPHYDLDRAPNRAEAVTLLVRLLGKEAEAASGSWSTPFNDIPDWAAPYIGYAYENGLASGVSAAAFGSSDMVSAAQYLTFVLRALGYEDGVDFQWDEAWALTGKLGIPSGSYNAASVFTRGDAVLVSSSALDVKCKNGSKTLLETISENPASVPAASVAGKTFTCTGEAWPREDSSFSAQPDGAKATVAVISANEAVFTLEYPYPITEARNFVISFSKRTVTSPSVRDIHIFSFEYYKNDNAYSANGVYSLTDFENWDINSRDEDMSGVVFTETSAQDYKITWRAKLPDGCPFNFDKIGEYEMECTVGVFLGGGVEES